MPAQSVQDRRWLNASIRHKLFEIRNGRAAKLGMTDDFDLLAICEDMRFSPKTLRHRRNSQSEHILSRVLHSYSAIGQSAVESQIKNYHYCVNVFQSLRYSAPGYIKSSQPTRADLNQACTWHTQPLTNTTQNSPRWRILILPWARRWPWNRISHHTQVLLLRSHFRQLVSHPMWIMQFLW